MNIAILDSHLREFLKTEASAEEIGKMLSLCGPSVEKVTKKGDDWLYEIEVTSNRPDSLSVIGIAREAAAILPRFDLKAKFTPPKFSPPQKPAKILPLIIKNDPKLCFRVMAQVLSNVKIKPSPKFITERLEAAGIRSLNNVVDITNYVMLEIGHPAHVFDYDRIKTHKMVIRRSRKGEKLTTLDNKPFALPGGDSVIDDGTGLIIDLPGIMGTKNSVVVDDTKRILFFLENNDPKQMRKTSMTLGIQTLAASYNEKGLDPCLTETALRRGIYLYQKCANAKQASKIYDIFPSPPNQKIIKITIQLIEQYLGVRVQIDKVISILGSLGFDVIEKNSKELSVKIPTWRLRDISIPEDLIEEVARIYGYQNLPSIMPQGKLPENSQDRAFIVEDRIKNLLADLGFTETYTYSMQNSKQLKDSGFSPNNHLKIANPLSSDWVFMRRSLIPSLLTVVRENHQDNLRLFELANIYLPKTSDLPEEKPTLALVSSGENQFFKLKGILEIILEKLGITNLFLKPGIENNLYDKTVSATVFSKGKLLGRIGEISSQILINYSLGNPLTVLELDFGLLVKMANPNRTYTLVPVFPPIIEDLSFVVPETAVFADLLETIKSSSLLIAKATLIDSYDKNRTFRITFQDPKRNLTDKEVANLRQKIINEVTRKGLGTLKEKVGE